MRNSSKVIVSCLLFPLVIIGSAIAADPVKHDVLIKKESIDVDKIAADKLKVDSEALGLKPEDLKRYYEIINSPQGFYYKRGEANPYYVLAAEATTEKERMRFARLWVQGEEKDYEKLGKAIKAYEIARLERFGENPKVWDLSHTQDLITSGNSPSLNTSRVLFYIRAADCSQCDIDFKKLNNQLMAGLISGIDIFFVDTDKKTEDDSTKIRNWASKHNIDPSKVRNKLITLNFGDKSMAETIPYQEMVE